MWNLGGHITPEGSRFSKEDLLAVAVFVASFVLSLRIMSGNGLLPGNDPGVHLNHIFEIVKTGRVSLQQFSLTLPLLHVFVAIWLDLAGAVDLLQAVFFLKILMSFIGAISVLAVYLFCRETFGKVPALLSSIVLAISVPLMEITSWGGYPNMAALLYITLIFFLLVNNRFKLPARFLLIGIMALSLFLLQLPRAF